MELATISSNKSGSPVPVETPEQPRRRFRWWIVLPVVLVSMTTTTTDPVLLNDLMIKRYQVEYGLVDSMSPSSVSACDADRFANDSSYDELSGEVQKAVGQLNMIMAGVTALPAVMSYILLGANSDRIGRRPLLILPCIGRILRFIILLLVVQLNLSNVWLIMSSVVEGAFGSNSVLILGAIAYISDCTTIHQRSRALLLEEATVSLTRIFPLLGLGFWLQHHGYTLPVSIDLGINIAALIYVFLFQPESCGENNRQLFHFLRQLKRIRLAPVRGTYQVFLIQRPEHNQRTIILLTLTQISLFIILFGFVSINPLYLYGKPLCFNALDLAILTSAQFSLMIVVSIVLSFFQRRYIMNSLLLPLIGTITYMIHLTLFGVAHTVWLLYLGQRISRDRSSSILSFLFFSCFYWMFVLRLHGHLAIAINEIGQRARVCRGLHCHGDCRSTGILCRRDNFQWDLCWNSDNLFGNDFLHSRWPLSSPVGDDRVRSVFSA